MTDDILYFTTGSCALASIAALEEAGHAYRAERLTMSGDGAGDDGFVALSPLRQVPLLRTPDALVRETGAILFHLDAVHPKANLIPADVAGRRLAMQWLGLLGGTVHPTFRLLWRPARYVGEAAEAQAVLRTKSARYLTTVLAATANDLGDAEWALGARSAIDFYLHVFTRWTIGAGLSLPASLAVHHRRVAELPAMQRALAIETDTTPA